MVIQRILSRTKIRFFINDYYNNHNTRWVILGGDVDIIPAVHVYSCGKFALSDQYYSCIDTNYHWNGDGDTLFGEPAWNGDTVDYLADVYVGRIPCSNPDEAEIFINKMIAYESDTSVVGYQTKALFISSEIQFANDALMMNENIADVLPGNFDITYLHNIDDSTTALDSIRAGQGILVSCAHAPGPWAFKTFHPYNWGWGYDRHIRYDHFDTLNTNGQYSVFVNYTCYNAQLDYNYDSLVIARSFMLSPNAGGIAYLGSTSLESSLVFNKYHVGFFDSLFNGDSPQIAVALEDMKTKFVPQLPAIDNYYRLFLFSYMYLGDPMLEIYTETPKTMFYFVLTDTVGTGVQDVAGIVSSDIGRVEGAKVCLRWGWDCIYEIDYTDTITGYFCFNDVDFPSTGQATVVTTFPNHFVLVDTIHIVSGGPGGCPMMYVYDGTDYQFTNNILAQSEDYDLAYSNNADYYPIYNAPLLGNGSIKIRIKEDEKEISHIDQLGLKYVSYPLNKRVVYTHNNEFRYLSGDSLLPMNAIDNRGNDILELISSFDGNSIESSLPGYCIVKYRRSNGPAKPLIGGGGGIDPPPGGKTPPKFAATDSDNLRNKNVIVSVLDANDNWQTVNTIYPRVRRVSHFTDLSDAFTSKIMTVKIAWNDAISIDCLPYYYFEDYTVEQVETGVLSVSHSEEGDMSVEALIADDNEIVLSPGEYVDLEFGPIPYRKGRKIAAVFKTFGRYERISSDAGPSQGGFSFEQNYPNPFNPVTTFSFSLPVAAPASLTIFNILGQRVANLVDEILPAGRHEIVWAGRDSNGHPIATGIYFAKFKAADFTITRKIVMVK